MPDNLHPLVVHFPIALLLSSVSLYWAGLRWQGRGLDRAAWYTHLLGLAGTAVTLITGLIAAKSVPANSPALATVTTHKFLGLATFVVFGLLAVCAWRHRETGYSQRERVLHTVIQLIGVALVIATGYFGGELVFTYGVGVAALLP